MKLNNTMIKNFKEPKKYFDGGGLFLEVRANGSKYWRMKYRFNKKEKLLSFGVYPTVSLKQARDKREEAKKHLAEGIDPGQIKKQAQAEERAQGETFESIAREWHAKFSPRLTPNYAEDVMHRLEQNVLPFIGDMPIADVTAPELLAVVQRMEARGVVETARRQLQKCGQIFRYAVATGRADRDPSQDLKGAIPPPPKRHLASITEPKEVAGLLRAIDDYTGDFTTCCALKLAYLTFVRPGELRHAEWSEFDFEANEWRIPGPKMKMKEKHIVPLSRQAVMILESLRALTGNGKYIFPGVRSRSRPMSENTVNAALRRMGYTKEQMTGHGFRSMASTHLNELGWNRDAIERQLAHAERDEIRAAYNYAEFLPERRKMMQAWADYLDALKEKGKVVPFQNVENI